MKKLFFISLTLGILFTACNSGNENGAAATASATETETHSQAGIVDSISQPNVVQIAMSSPDHSTLVAAVKAADLATSLSNAGPFTIFAPTNEAFNKLPAGTVDGLMKPENKNALTDILQYHAYVGVIKPEQLQDGQTLGMVDGKSITVKIIDGKPVINNNAHIIASIPASNGIVHVIDEVLQPAQ